MNGVLLYYDGVEVKQCPFAQSNEDPNFDGLIDILEKAEGQPISDYFIVLGSVTKVLIPERSSDGRYIYSEATKFSPPKTYDSSSS